MNILWSCSCTLLAEDRCKGQTDNRCNGNDETIKNNHNKVRHELILERFLKLEIPISSQSLLMSPVNICSRRRGQTLHSKIAGAEKQSTEDIDYKMNISIQFF